MSVKQFSAFSRRGREADQLSRIIARRSRSFEVTVHRFRARRATATKLIFRCRGNEISTNISRTTLFDVVYRRHLSLRFRRLGFRDRGESEIDEPRRTFWGPPWRGASRACGCTLRPASASCITRRTAPRVHQARWAPAQTELSSRATYVDIWR